MIVRTGLSLPAICLVLLIACQKPVKTPDRPSRAGYLGVLYVTNRDGLRILKIFPESPATRAGLIIGDTITGVDGRSISGAFSFKEHIRSLHEGDKVQLNIMDVGGSSRSVVAVINEIPEGLEGSDPP